MYKLSGKNLSLLRLIPRGKNTDSRLRYLHVSPKGTAIITPIMTCRVSLPAKDNGGDNNAMLLTDDMIEKLPRLMPESDEVIEVPTGPPAITSPHYLVPRIEAAIPAPNETLASITVNADILRKMLTVASEVTKDGDKTIRLRICPKRGVLRMDTYRQPGEQEFLGVLTGIEYRGNYIPGEVSEKSLIEEKPVQSTRTLKSPVGRRFRTE